METEIEVKILDVNVLEIKERLKVLGAKFISERNMKRKVYDFNPPKDNSWIRLRDNGKSVTLTIKEIENDDIDGTKELEVTVDDFNKTDIILQKLGFYYKRHEENKRISYSLDGVDVEIDSWPEIPTYVEIEGKSVKAVEGIVKKLGYAMGDTTAINTIKVYKKYGLDLTSKKDWRLHSSK